MRIIHLVNHCVHGGNVMVPVDLACVQAAAGHSVIYASAGGRYQELLDRNGVRHVTLNQSLRDPLTAAAALKSFYALCREFQPTVIHAHMMSGAVIGYAVSRLLGLPLVTTVHNSFDRHSRLMRLGDHVAAVSDVEARLLLQRGFRPERLHVILNGTIGSPRDSWTGSDAIRAIEGPCIATVCGLEKRKAVDVLIEAFHAIAPRAPDWHLYIAGDGPEREALEGLAAREESGRRIHFLGYVENPRQVLDKTDIFALASLAEPFGLSLAEARHAGCAVIGTNVGGIPEVLDNGEAGTLVPPGDAAALAATLRQLTTNPQALAEARQRAKRNSDRFNVRRVAEDYMDLYALAARQRSAPARAGTAPSTNESMPAPASIAQPANGQRLRIAIGIATLGRPAVLAQTLQRLRAQVRPADGVIVCAPDGSDLQGARESYPGVVEIVGPRGLARQRNAILEATRDFDVIVFFDDDFVAREDYLANVEAAMRAHPDVVMTTGRLLDDGILGPGLSFADADRLLKEHGAEPSRGAPVEEVYNGYGCNMSMRLAPIAAHRLAFDERLPLYGWLEDVDFSRQLARHGRIVSIDARGVHLGVKQGRQPGLKLGYSQVANPLYLIGKGTMSPGRALTLMGRNLLANAVRSLKAEPWVDRRGRLSGNLRAVADLLTGRLDPNRVARL